MVDGASPSGHALGSQGSGTCEGYFGIVLKNTSGVTLNTITILFDPVINRNPSSTQNKWIYSYLVNSTIVDTVAVNTLAGTFHNLAGTWTTIRYYNIYPLSGTGAPGTQAAISPLFKIGGATVTKVINGVKLGS
jgi:hypothetical protein